MIQNDTWLRTHGPDIIRPYLPDTVRDRDGVPCLSYGTSSYGYDIRLGSEFAVYRRIPGSVGDVKTFDKGHLDYVDYKVDDKKGFYYVLPAHSYGLGVSYEYISVPDDVLVLCLGKSTYARAGLILNTTPLEPGWKGHITLEISNSSHDDQRIYLFEGIAQLLFFRGEPCEMPYGLRSGKYQNQSYDIKLPKV